MGRERLRQEGVDRALEVLVPRDEIGLAGELHHGSRGSVGGDGAADQALRRRAAGPLLGLGDAARAQELGRAAQVAARLLQRLLAVHHARAGPGAEFRHIPS